jgi:very-short-patch-repair endonuclease
VASHQCAAWLFDISRAPTRIHITTTARGYGLQGIHVHRVGSIHPDDRTEIENIPVTSLPRTLLDLAEVLPINRLERAIENAERRQLFDLNAMNELMDRSSGRHGLKPLSMLLSKLIEPARTRSELERSFLDRCREAGFPRPQVNALVAGYEVDAVWSDQRLIVELDGYAFHGTRAAFERDRSRDVQLQLAGYRVLRITGRMLDSGVAALGQLLAS